MRRILTAASLYSVTATALRTALLTSTPPIAAATALNRAGFASMTVAIDKPTVVERLDEIASPPLDERHYRWVKLSNGLEALLVHDKDAVLAFQKPFAAKALARRDGLDVKYAEILRDPKFQALLSDERMASLISVMGVPKGLVDQARLADEL